MNYSVSSIKPSETYDWLLNKHYAKRIPSISYAFGLYLNRTLEGVCTFGIPASRFDYQPYELNRLVVNELPKNTLSFFVSSCLKMFPRPNIIVSYADPNNGHHGYIYQATNWIYTGLSSAEHLIFMNGKQYHRRTCYDTFGTSSIPKLKEIDPELEIIHEKPKHRYFYIVGSNGEKKHLRNKIPTMQPYPKGDNDRYDASYKPSVQGVLF